jgi:hypothetical protein
MAAGKQKRWMKKKPAFAGFVTKRCDSLQRGVGGGARYSSTPFAAITSRYQRALSLGMRRMVW